MRRNVEHPGSNYLRATTSTSLRTRLHSPHTSYRRSVAGYCPRTLTIIIIIMRPTSSSHELCLWPKDQKRLRPQWPRRKGGLLRRKGPELHYYIQSFILYDEERAPTTSSTSRYTLPRDPPDRVITLPTTNNEPQPHASIRASFIPPRKNKTQPKYSHAPQNHHPHLNTAHHHHLQLRAAYSKEAPTHPHLTVNTSFERIPSRPTQTSLNQNLPDTPTRLSQAVR